MVGTAYASKASSEEVQSIVRTVKPRTVFVELDRARAMGLRHEHHNTDEQGGVKARHLFAAAYPTTPSHLHCCSLFWRMQGINTCGVVPYAVRLMPADCVQAFFAKIASGAGVNVRQELVNQSLAGELRTQPEGCREAHFRIASDPLLCISPDPTLTSSECSG